MKTVHKNRVIRLVINDGEEFINLLLFRQAPIIKRNADEIHAQFQDVGALYS
jgi:hypothetical protein